MELRENERIEDLHRDNYKLIQNTKKFCFGIDAVLLAWFAQVPKDAKVVDLCSGNGIIPIIMDARYHTGDYTGLEIQEDMVEMAERSVLLNGISDHVHFVQGDLKEASKLFGRSCVDVVTVNPPYMPASHGLTNPDSAKAIARHEILCTLEDVIRESAAILKPMGHFYMIHKPTRLTEILTLMKTYKIAPSHITMVYPTVEKEATMVMISGTRSGKDMLKVDAPIIVYEDNHEYTERVKKIYWE